MRKGFMVTGLAVATLAAGCGTNKCPTPTVTATTPSAAAEKAEAKAATQAKNQAEIDKIAQQAVSHFVNQAAAAQPQITRTAELTLDYGTFADKARNYDDSGFTHLIISEGDGHYGRDLEVTKNDLSAQYENGHPGNVRNLIISESDIIFKRGKKHHIAQDNHGILLSKEDESTASQYRFKLSHGHWLLTDTTGGTWAGNAVAERITTPDAAQELVDNAQQVVKSLLP
jgi:hypothetical protein